MMDEAVSVCLDANSTNIGTANLARSKQLLIRTESSIFTTEKNRKHHFISFPLSLSLTMRFAPLLAGLATLVSSVSATALTYRLEANEKACFFTSVDQANAKVAFYFAVS